MTDATTNHDHVNFPYLCEILTFIDSKHLDEEQICDKAKIPFSLYKRVKRGNKIATDGFLYDLIPVLNQYGYLRTINDIIPKGMIAQIEKDRGTNNSK